jgi:glutamate/tyrosine decarboxylase-like PLP-dependent enzyme
MRADQPLSTAGQFIANEAQSFREEVRTLRVAPSVTSAEIRRRLEPYTFDGAMPLIDALRDVAGLLRRGTLHAAHPRYFGLFVPSVHDAGVWADALVAIYNPQLGAWWHAPAAAEIETHTLKFLADVLGFDAGAAHFTSGASEANLTAVCAATLAAYPDALDVGVGAAAARGAIYVSSQAHHSLDKAVRVAGLGNRILRRVPCNAKHQLDVTALRAMIDADVAAGHRAVLIVGTFGTTTAGALDDLQALADIAHRHSAWFHVDAAWGGAAAFSSRLRPLLQGIERADSVTWDAHKSLSVPMGAGMFFCRDRDTLKTLFDVEATYVPKSQEAESDPYLMSLQWSRRFIGLKVFLTLAALGREGVAERIERQCTVANYLRQRLTAAGWRIVNDSPLPLVCFTHPSLTGAGRIDGVAKTIALGGRVWLSVSSLPEGQVLRACITHDETSVDDVDVLCEELGRALEQHVGLLW